MNTSDQGKLQETDLEKLERLMHGIREFQQLADTYQIDDVFQDNGGKVLQSLIILEIKALPGREGNDAIDASGDEYELKTINILKQTGVSTHHHLNTHILDKYRAVKGWYISLYEGIELKEIYLIPPSALAPLFADWETKLSKVSSINNPKIPLKLVLVACQNKQAKRVYPPGEFVPGSVLESLVGKKAKAGDI